MPDLVEQQAPAQAARQQGKTLQINIRIDDGSSLAEIVNKAEELGEVVGLNLYSSYDPYYG